jgi:biopolymer transport protein ExbB
VVLDGLVAAAPLLGLLGTVMGMIATFSTLSGRGTASMELLSGGISEALITTQVGLVVALPGLLAAHAVGRRVADLDAALDRIGLRLADPGEASAGGGVG